MFLAGRKPRRIRRFQPSLTNHASEVDTAPGIAVVLREPRLLEKEPSRAPDAAQKLKVVTTVAPITSIVENVAGDKADIAGIIPEGINSHTFEPAPSDSKLLSKADIIIFNGLDLETPTVKLAQANLKQGAAIYSLGDKTIKEDQYIYDFSFPKEQGHPNPHLWLNPEYAMRYAALARDELIGLDPKNKNSYETNSAQFIKNSKRLIRRLKTRFRPFRRANVACSLITTLGPILRAVMDSK